MAGFTKNPRHGKRPPSSSSSSSFFSTVGMVLLVAFCCIGVWMLTSSSSQAAGGHVSRVVKPISRFLKDPPPMEEEDVPVLEKPVGDDGQGNEQEEAQQQQEEVKEESNGGDQQEEVKQEGNAGEQEEEVKQEMNAGDQQQLDGGEAQQTTEVASEESQNQENQQESEVQTGESHQEAHDEQQPMEENQQETLQKIETQGEESQQPQVETQREESQQDIQHQQQEKLGEIDWENQQEAQQNRAAESHEEAQMKNGDIENRQEINQEVAESNAEGNQQETQGENNENNEQTLEKVEEESTEISKPEIDENHDPIEPHIEEVTTESNEGQQQTEIETISENSQQEMGGNEGQQQGDVDNLNSNDLIPDADQSEVPNMVDVGGKKKAWATQADQSESEKERRMGDQSGYEWELCNVTAGPDYIPCLDNEKAIKLLHIKHYEHRERHCPEESPSCLVPLPNGYRHSIEWPKSRDRIWYNNVPHTKLAEVKGHQNWVKVTGEHLTFPGGGTQFIHGALHYIDFIQQSVHDIAWGKHTRVVLDVGCGVASFGGYLFERDVLTMSFAPKDEHEAQVQLALERGIPAMSAVMGSQRLPFPSRVFDLVHCARCRVPWHADGGMLLLELNRVLRPGGYFVWSATPVYQRLKEDVEIWKAMKALTVSMCWDLVSIKKDKLNSVGAAFFRKPVSNECYDNRKHHSPPMCKEDDDPIAAWYIPLKTCMHRVPMDASDRGSRWPEQWPQRLQVPPYWLNDSQIGIYGKTAPDDFRSDYEHWKRVVTKSYLTGFGINWSKVRNVMDMRAVYGGFSAALRDLKVWSLNVVNIDSPDTLPIIYERGLFGIYHDWCESFSTYPRTYDLLHADHLFSRLKKRCKIVPVLAEVDRIVRPGGKLIIRDESRTVSELENLLKSLHWEVHLTFSKDQEGILCAEKSDWRPEKISDSS